MQRTSVEQREWEAEVEEARRLHEDEGLSAADAVSKAHSEAVWLKEQKRKLEHAQKMMELDQKWGAAKQKEAKRLVEQEKMSLADAEEGAGRGALVASEGGGEDLAAGANVGGGG